MPTEAHRRSFNPSGPAHAALAGREVQFEDFARVVALSIDTYDRSQLELGIEIFLRGVQAVFLRHFDTGPVSHC
jgi:hypothetical protein